MMRLLKLLAVVLLVLVVGVFVTAIFFLNPILEKAKPSIEKTIARTIQAPVTLGPVEVSALPSPRISVSDLKVGNAEGGFTLGRLILNCELLPLLRGSLQVKTVELSTASLAVSKDTSGKLIIGGVDLSKLQDPSKAKTAEKEADAAPLDLAIREVEMSNINLTYQDSSRTPPVTISMTNLAMTAKGISPLGAESFRITGALLNPDHQNFELSGAVQLDKLTRLPTGDISLVIQAFDLEPVAPLIVSLTPEFKDKLRTKGPLDGSLRLKLAGVKYDYELKMHGTKAEIELADTFIKKAGTEFSIEGSGNMLATGVSNLTSSDLKIGSAKISANFADLEKKSVPKSVGINFDIPDLGQLSGLLPALANLAPIGKLSGTIQLTKKESNLAIASGNINGSGIAISPGGAQQFEEGTLVAKLSPENIELSDLSLKRSGEVFKFEGDIAPSTLANVARDIAMRSTSFLGGSINVDANVNPHEKVTKAKLNGGGISLERAAGAAGAGESLGITGTIESLLVDSNINSADPNRTTAGVNVSITNGSILRFNVLADIFKALNQLPVLGFRGEDVEGSDSILNAKGTAFDSLKINSRVAGSMINLDSATLVHQQYSISGKGNIDLKGAAKISCEVTLPIAMAQRITARFEKFRLGLNSDGSLTVPVVIKRSDASSPWIVLPDVKKLGEKILKGAGRDVVKDKGSKLLDKVSPGLGSAVKSLF